MKLFIQLGAMNAFLAVGFGAFGAHMLEGKIPDHYLGTWETAVMYHMFHALGLLAVGLLAGKVNDVKSIKWSGWLLFVGIILFSGSLYVLSLTQISVLGAITPLGGVSFLAGWIGMIIAAKKAA